MRYSELPQRANPYGVPYRPAEPSDASLVPIFDEFLAGYAGGFEGSQDSQNREAKPRKPQFSHDQLYLFERVNASATKPLTYGMLAKLNGAFGVTEVSEAMRDACLADGVGSAYAYVYSVCRETA